MTSLQELVDRNLPVDVVVEVGAGGGRLAEGDIDAADDLFDGDGAVGIAVADADGHGRFRRQREEQGEGEAQGAMETWVDEHEAGQ